MKLDARAVEELYRKHIHHVLRRARSILGDEEGRDVAQEVFVSLLQNPDAFSGHSAPMTFLYAMTTHRCLNRLRDRKNRARLVELHVKPEATSPSNNSVNAGEARAALFELLPRLPAELAEVAVYRYVDEMTHDEIAVVLACSRRHVGNLLERFHDNARALIHQPAPGEAPGPTMTTDEKANR